MTENGSLPVRTSNWIKLWQTSQGFGGMRLPVGRSFRPNPL